MPAASDNTWNLVPPRRPSLADCGSAQKVDDALFPPDALLMPTAAEWNLFAKLLAALGDMVPNASVTVSFAGVAVSEIHAMSSNAAVLSPTSYAVAKNGTGDYTVWWSPDLFPPRTRQHRAWVIGTTGGCYLQPDVRPVTGGPGGTIGARVVIKDTSIDVADADFILDIY